MPTTAVSAPGKVLLAGGYLVLDRQYNGLVFGLSARIHVLVDDVDTGDGVQLSEVLVTSPQFTDARWNYGYHVTTGGGGVAVTQLQSQSPPSSPNPFVETTLVHALTYIAATLPSPAPLRPVHLTILADPAYYSHPPTTRLTTAASPAQFAAFSLPLAHAHKTGLGSSAALVTSLTLALLTHYLPAPPSPTVLHNLAQAAHCAAQGKIGSGFDVAAAVYGTCYYRRFSPAILSLPAPGTAGFAAQVKAVVDDEPTVWDTEIGAGIKLPAGTALVMCDVDCGSQTVSMVKSVLAWRARDPASNTLLDALQAANTALGEALKGGDETTIGEAFGAVRAKLRELGTKSGVPIEPEEQTKLLDGLTAVEGVLGGVVPGAGGYDAVVLLIRDDAATLEHVNEFLVRWTTEGKGNVKLLQAKGELEGARVEDSKRYDLL